MEKLKLAYPDVPALWVDWLVDWATEHPEEYNRWIQGDLIFKPKVRDQPGEIKNLNIINNE